MHIEGDKGEGGDLNINYYMHEIPQILKDPEVSFSNGSYHTWIIHATLNPWFSSFLDLRHLSIIEWHPISKLIYILQSLQRDCAMQVG